MILTAAEERFKAAIVAELKNHNGVSSGRDFTPPLSEKHYYCTNCTADLGTSYEWIGYTNGALSGHHADIVIQTIRAITRGEYNADAE